MPLATRLFSVLLSDFSFFFKGMIAIKTNDEKLYGSVFGVVSFSSFF